MFRIREMPSRYREMKARAVDEARDYLAALPRSHTQTRASWLHSGCRFFGISESLGKKLWYREVERMDADTLLRMRERFDALKEAQIKRQELLNDAADLLAAFTNDAARVTDSSGREAGGGERSRENRQGGK